MKLFVILLCIAIGSVFGELERRKFRKEKFEVTEDVNEARSLVSLDDGKNPSGSDGSLEVKYALDNSFDQIAANTKDANSVEKETSRNPSPVIETSTVKPNSTKAMKKNLQIMYLRKPAKYFQMLRKISKPKDARSESKQETLNYFFRSFLKDTDELSRKETNLVSKPRTLLRRKRDLEEIKIEDPTNLVESLKSYRQLRDKLPLSLRQQIQKTDKFEEKMLKHYSKSSNRAPDALYKPYYQAIKKEREIVFHLAGSTPIPDNEAWAIFNNYRALRKGRPLWNFIALRPSLEKFFKDESSSGFSKYINTKQDERDFTYVEGVLGVNTEDNQLDEEDEDKGGTRYNYGTLQKVFNQDLREKVAKTEEVEDKILNSCKNAPSDRIPKSLVDEYYDARKKEIEQFKKDFANSGLKKRRLNIGYHAFRKGSTWWSIRHINKAVFAKESPCRSEYEAIKKEEKYTDQYLDGSMKIGEVPKKNENTKAEDSERTSSQSESEKAKRMLKSKVAERARAKEDEKAEEMERRVRAKETETVEVEYDAYRVNVENVVVTTDDAKGDVEVHGSPDNVTSANDTNTKTTTDSKSKDTSYLLGFAILFVVTLQVIIGILILAPQRNKLAEWCKRIKRTEPGHAETEPLQVGEKVMATEPTSKSSKSPLNADLI